jgi:hypothetical protein
LFFLKKKRQKKAQARGFDGSTCLDIQKINNPARAHGLGLIFFNFLKV